MEEEVGEYLEAQPAEHGLRLGRQQLQVPGTDDLYLLLLGLIMAGPSGEV
jgi:hypothetical protein